MATNVYDTSALGKHYHAERGTETVDRLLGTPVDMQTISRLSVVELQSVLAKKVRMGELTLPDLQIITRRFRSDIAAPRIRVIRLMAAHFQRTEQLLQRHATTRNLRTLDALQLAVALRFHAATPIRFHLCGPAVMHRGRVGRHSRHQPGKYVKALQTNDW